VQQPAEGNSVSRRNFLKYSIYGIGGLIFVAVAGPLVRYFFSPALSSTNEGEWIVVAKKSDIPIAQPTPVQYESRKNDSWIVTTESKSAWIVTEDGQNFTVYDPHCTHLGCPYTWVDKGGPNKGQFECPCHSGVFAIDGTVLSGPPPRPLDRVLSQVDGDSIMVKAVVQLGRAEKG
jgi:menaquinol-cytochrome c reductase iron-sulfur subunit